jgi:hypothetical protein
MLETMSIKIYHPLSPWVSSAVGKYTVTKTTTARNNNAVSVTNQQLPKLGGDPARIQTNF